MGNSTVTDVLFGQNLFSILSSCKAHIRPVGFTVFYRYLLDKALLHIQLLWIMVLFIASKEREVFSLSIGGLAKNN